ncbi:MAG: translation initiation factor IF-2 [Hadesarchaea archaeon]|nr:translation initiation factor IF-2 [Hadesarchaea archaeon]
MVAGRRIRQPIVSVLGHVDHGKTLLLDRIRGTTVAAREAGAITQHIGATEVPVETIEELCSGIMERFGVGVKLPGLLFIDTPGHEAFANLRRRGGALADLAVLVIDINEGFMPQTLESISLLKSTRTPFVVAANKIDLVPGWRPVEGACFMDSVGKQNRFTQAEIDRKIYELVGKLHDLGFDAERFDRVGDFRRQVCIVPTSAKTGEGIPELLAILAGLAQRFMGKELTVEVRGPARGTVLEVKEEVGLGTTIDAIIYEGTLSKRETIAVGGLRDVMVSKVRALLQPKPLDEIRDPQDKFRYVDEVVAAAGVKIVAQGLEGALAGAPVWAVRSEKEIDELRQKVRDELDRLRIALDINGVVVKADTLGSLEALEGQLRVHRVPIRRADIGEVSRRDVVEAATVARDDPLLGVVLAFNVGVSPDAREEARNRGVQLIKQNVIYKLIEAYEEWVEQKREEVKRKKLEGFFRPAKFVIKQGFVFRRSNPAIVGVDILGGVLKPKSPIMRKDGRQVGKIKEIQRERESVAEAKMGDELAVSIEGGVVGRNINEGDILYVDIPRDHVIVLKRDLKDVLSADELDVLGEIIAVKQRKDPTYGIM